MVFVKLQERIEPLPNTLIDSVSKKNRMNVQKYERKVND